MYNIETFVGAESAYRQDRIRDDFVRTGRLPRRWTLRETVGRVWGHPVGRTAVVAGGAS